ncbi:glycoside hydrolase 43 family protein [Spirochaetia bacterium]|nr:glycoside hydrolase 43 family protein [Spirochaetia bacterium]
MYTYHNPVIPGFNPDPSICRDGEDFYLVTSSFEFFPGVPIYHSKNLVNWECIGHCLTRPSQLPLANCQSSGGIYAPTIRKYKGLFYMTTTNVDMYSKGRPGNFIVHTDDILNSWSEPVWIDQGGIDPSLLFFDDKTYFCSTGGEMNSGYAGDTEHGIYLCEIDPLSGKKFSPSKLISKGTGGRFAEAPHLYHINGMFYLMLAEGGTEYGHMVTVQRSRSIYGPYEPCPHNPVLSHRNRGGHPIQATGHADMMEDQNGAWWLVCLGIRPLPRAMLHNLGRETFLSPLRWIDGWPVVGNNSGIELEMEGPLPAAPEPINFNYMTDFSGPLDPNWNYIRNPVEKNYVVKSGCLTLKGDDQTLSTANGNPVFIGMRQQAYVMSAETTLRPPETGKAGITAFYNYDYHYEIFVERNGEGDMAIVLNKRIHDLEAETFRQKIPACDKVSLRIKADTENYTFEYKCGEGVWITAGRGLCAGLCTETTHTMTFTGVYIGLFAGGGNADFLYSKSIVPKSLG